MERLILNLKEKSALAERDTTLYEGKLRIIGLFVERLFITQILHFFFPFCPCGPRSFDFPVTPPIEVHLKHTEEVLFCL